MSSAERRDDLRDERWSLSPPEICCGCQSNRRAFPVGINPTARRCILIVVCLFAVTGCRQKMATQPAYRPLRATTFFRDGLTARPRVPGTIARGELPTEATELPITMESLKRGRERFDIYCAMCHDRTGGGDGMIVQRGYARPPSYQIERLRKASDDYIFDVITHGHGAMPEYASQIPQPDRWAIVGYVRALQRAGNATLADVANPGAKKKLEETP
jgi:mono/diheme cytochrome c family protein